MWKQAVAVCLKLLIVILWLLRKGDIHLEMSQQLDAGSCSVCFRNQKCGAKLTVRSKKTVIGWSFKQLLGRTVVGLMERKCVFCSHKVQYPNSLIICVYAEWKNFSKIAKYSGSFLQKYLEG